VASAQGADRGAFGVELVLPAVNAIIAGLAVALVALSISFTVLLSSWWMRDRKRRRDREAARKARQEIDERAWRRVRLHVTYVAGGRPGVW
jgi:uncharacterized protein HemY